MAEKEPPQTQITGSEPGPAMQTQAHAAAPPMPVEAEADPNV